MRARTIFSSHGFTLIEVMIVLAIMSALTILSAQSIQQGIRSKVKIQSTTDDMSRVRDALKIMERDINLTFNYLDLETEMLEAVKKRKTQLLVATTTTQPGNPGGPPPPPGAAFPNDPNANYVCPPETTDPLCSKKQFRISPVTSFVGKTDELSFATLNAGRLSEASLQADFVKVGYSVRGCRRPGPNDTVISGRCLIRRSGNIVDGDLTKGGAEVVLLEDISEFKLRYFGKGKQDWNSDWNSIQGDGATKGRFPDLVEISLAVEKGQEKAKKKISMQLVVPLRFPNNPQKSNSSASTGGLQGGGP